MGTWSLKAGELETSLGSTISASGSNFLLQSSSMKFSNRYGQASNFSPWWPRSQTKEILD